MKKATIALLGVFALVFFAAVFLIKDVHDIKDIVIDVAPSTISFGYDDSVTATFYGVSTILFDDGQTQVMIDGFFSRPSAIELFFGKFSPNVELLQRVADLEKFDRLAVIVPAHSHHDHVMDSAPLAKITGAQVLGSQTTAFVAEGWGLSQDQITVAESLKRYKYGRFSLTLIPSEHFVAGPLAACILGLGKSLEAALSQPAGIRDYKEGVSYSILVEHPDISFLVHASAGFIPGALDKFAADVVFLGVAGLSSKAESHIQEYLDNVVFAVSSELIIPVHWDSFTRRAGNATVPRVLDDLEVTINQMESYLEGSAVKILALVPKALFED